jgi:hypothetical protein
MAGLSRYTLELKTIAKSHNLILTPLQYRGDLEGRGDGF